MDSIKNNPVISTIVIILVVLIVIYIVWKMYKLHKKNKLVTPVLWSPISKVGPIIKNTLKDVKGKDIFSPSKANKQNIVPTIGDLSKDQFILQWPVGNLPNPKSVEYSYSIWFRVKDWNYNYGIPKNLFLRGKPLGQGFTCNPGVWLHPVTNNLIIRVDTLINVPEYKEYASIQTKYKAAGLAMLPYIGYDVTGGTGADAESISYPTPTSSNLIGGTNWNTGKEFNTGIKDSTMGNYNSVSNGHFMPEMACDIKNIPSQSWVNLTITLFNRSLDVFINGKLNRSCTLRGVPRMKSHNDGDISLCYSPPGKNISSFDGDITRFKYWPRTLNAHEVYDYYEKGATDLLSGIKGLIPAVKFQYAVNTGGKTYGSM